MTESIRDRQLAKCVPVAVSGLETLDQERVAKMSDSDLAKAITRTHALCQDYRAVTICFAVQCGGLLLKAKERVEHGRWIDWLADNCQLGSRQSQRYMGLARKFLSLTETTRAAFLGLSIRTAERLLQGQRLLPAESDAPKGKRGSVHGRRRGSHHALVMRSSHICNSLRDELGELQLAVRRVASPKERSMIWKSVEDMRLLCDKFLRETAG